MSTTAEDDRITTYSPIVPRTEFPADFPVFDNSDLWVYVNGVRRTDFTVSATYSNGVSNDARAVFSAPGVAGDVQVVGMRHPRRIGRFAPGAPVPTENLNLQFDTLTAEVQEAARDLQRAIKTPPGGVSLSLAADLSDGDTLMINGQAIAPGPKAGSISAAQGYAEEAAAARDSAQGAKAGAQAAQAAAEAAVARVDLPVVAVADAGKVLGVSQAGKYALQTVDLSGRVSKSGDVMSGNLEIRRASALIQLAQADGTLPWTMKYEPGALAFYYNGVTKNQFRNDGDFYSAAAGGWLASLLAGKAAASHTHTMSQITDLSIVPPAPPAIGSQVVSAGGFGYGAIVAGSQLNVGGTSLPGTWRADGAVIEAAIYSYSSENGPSWPTVRYCFCTRIS